MKNVIMVARTVEHAKKVLTPVSGYQFHFYTDLSEAPEEVLECAEILIGVPEREYLPKMPNLKWVQMLSAGVNRALWLPEDIILSNISGVYGRSIAEYLTAATLSLLQLLPQYQEQQRSRIWEKIGDAKLVSECKVLSVGMGDLGSRYLEHMHMLGAKCYCVRRMAHEKPDFIEGSYTAAEMDDILGEFDIVALCLPETPETIGMFNEKRMRRMKQGAILLNAGRGTAIVTEDLIKLAGEGRFRGVVLDVTDPEPLPEDHPLWNAPDVYITPHISGRYEAVYNIDRVLEPVVSNLTRYLKGAQLHNVIDRKRGY